MYQCSIDRKVFDSLESLRDHLSKRHLGWLRYRCCYCETFLASLAKVQMHNNECHPGMPNQYRDGSDDQMKRDLGQIENRCLAEAPIGPQARKRKLIQPSGNYWTQEASNPAFEEYPYQVEEPIIEDTRSKSPKKLFQASSKPDCIDQKTWDEFSKCDRPFCFVCNETITSNPNNHIRLKHLREKLVTCSLCNYKTVTRHAMTTHFKRHHQNLRKQFVDESQEKVNSWKVKCFGRFLTTGILDSQPFLDIWNKKSDRLFCVECNKSSFFSTMSSVVNHIMMVHLKRECVYCIYCDYTNCGDLRILSNHMKNKHPVERQPKFRDERLPLELEVKQLFAVCFAREIEKGNLYVENAAGPDDYDDVAFEDDSQIDPFQNASQSSMNHDSSVVNQESNLTLKFCQICQENVNVSDTEMHIFTKHIRKDVFSCRYCQHKHGVGVSDGVSYQSQTSQQGAEVSG